VKNVILSKWSINEYILPLKGFINIAKLCYNLKVGQKIKLEINMQILLPDLTLKLISPFLLPERKYDSSSKKWIPTGEKTQRYELTFVDSNRDTLVLVSSQPYFDLDGRNVNVELALRNDAFRKGFIKISLVSVKSSD